MSHNIFNMDNTRHLSSTNIRRAVRFVLFLLFTGITAVRADNTFWTNQQVEPVWRGEIGGDVEIWLLTYDEEGLDDYIRWLDLYAESGGKEELIFKMWGEHGRNEYGSKYGFPTTDGSGENVTVRIRDKKKRGDTYWIQLKIWLPDHYWGRVGLRFHGRFAYEKNNNNGVNFNFVKEVETRSYPKFLRYLNPKVEVADFYAPDQFYVQIWDMFVMRHCVNKLSNSFTQEEVLRTEGVSSIYTERNPITPNTLEKLRYTLSFSYGTNTYDHHIDISIPRVSEPKNLTVTYHPETKLCRLQWAKTDAGKWVGEKWMIYRREGTEDNWRSEWKCIASLPDTDTLLYTDTDTLLMPGKEYTYAVVYYRDRWKGGTTPDDTFVGGRVSAVVSLPPLPTAEDVLAETLLDTTVVLPTETLPVADAIRPFRYSVATVIVAAGLLGFLWVYLRHRRRKRT